MHAEWAALSTEERQRRKRRRVMFDEVSRVAYEAILAETVAGFKNSDLFLRALRR